MDPDANLKEQLSLIRRFLDLEVNKLTGPEMGSLVYDACRLAELVEALDGWITRGGFVPERWQPWWKQEIQP